MSTLNPLAREASRAHRPDMRSRQTRSPRSALSLTALTLIALSLASCGPAQNTSVKTDARAETRSAATGAEGDDVEGARFINDSQIGGSDGPFTLSARASDRLLYASFTRRLERDEPSAHHDEDDDERLERILLGVTLRAQYTGNQDTQEATEEILFELTHTLKCDQTLDHEGELIQAALGFSDLDGDGEPELVWGFEHFCGGGVDPFDIALVAITTRAPFMSCTLAGESLIVMGEGRSFGGESELLGDCDRAPAAFGEALSERFKTLRLRPYER